MRRLRNQKEGRMSRQRGFSSSEEEEDVRPSKQHQGPQFASRQPSTLASFIFNQSCLPSNSQQHCLIFYFSFSGLVSCRLCKMTPTRTRPNMQQVGYQIIILIIIIILSAIITMIIEFYGSIIPNAGPEYSDSDYLGNSSLSETVGVVGGPARSSSYIPFTYLHSSYCSYILYTYLIFVIFFLHGQNF